MYKRAVAIQNGGTETEPIPNSFDCRCNGDASVPDYALQKFPWLLMVMLWCLVMVMLTCVPYLAKVIPPAERTDIRWWTTSVVYQLPPTRANEREYFTEFVSRKVEEIHDLGVNAVRLSNFLKLTPDGAVLDYMSLNEAYGSMADFLSLTELLKQNDIKVIIDVPLAYTSTAHPWFCDDELNRSQDSIFFWKNLPENKEEHLETFWSRSNSRQDYYLHVQNKPNWALINYSSRAARQKIRKVFHYWMEYGVSGFILLNCDNVTFNELGKQPVHPTNANLRKLADLIRSVKVELNAARLQQDHKYNENESDVLLAVDIRSSENNVWRSLYKAGVDLIINKDIVSSSADTTSSALNPIYLQRQVDKATSKVPQINTHNWMICEEIFSLKDIHDDRFLKLVNMIHLLLPGMTLLCEEQLPQQETTDYTAAKEHFQMLVEWRKVSAMSWGQIQTSYCDREVFSFVRYALGKVYPRYIIIINFSSEPRRHNFTMNRNGLVVSDLGTLRYSTCSNDSRYTNSAFRYTTNSPVFLNDTYINARCGLLVELNLKTFW